MSLLNEVSKNKRNKISRRLNCRKDNGWAGNDENVVEVTIFIVSRPVDHIC